MVLARQEEFVKKYTENFLVLPSTSDTVQVVFQNFLHWAGQRAFIADQLFADIFRQITQPLPQKLNDTPLKLRIDLIVSLKWFQVYYLK